MLQVVRCQRHTKADGTTNGVPRLRKRVGTHRMQARCLGTMEAPCYTTEDGEMRNNMSPVSSGDMLQTGWCVKGTREMPLKVRWCGRQGSVMPPKWRNTRHRRQNAMGGAMPKAR